METKTIVIIGIAALLLISLKKDKVIVDPGTTPLPIQPPVLENPPQTYPDVKQGVESLMLSQQQYDY